MSPGQWLMLTQLALAMPPRQPLHAVTIPPASHQPSAQFGRVVADTFWSQSLGTRKRAMIWLPASYATRPERRYPVAYYLHGAFGDETNWLNAGNLGATLDSLAAAGLPELIVVMPDGDDGFYTTWNFLGDYAGCRRNRPATAEPAESYCVPWPHYDDYVARDLVHFIDGRYRTLANRRQRGVAGLSMGGYGAVSLALAYPDVFSAAASHSGVLTMVHGTTRAPVPHGRFDLGELRASYAPSLWPHIAAAIGRDSMAWAARDPSRFARRLLQTDPAVLPALRVDCGLADPYLIQSRAFRDTMERLGVPVEYAEHPGTHDWDYWRRHAAESAAWLARRLAVP